MDATLTTTSDPNPQLEVKLEQIQAHMAQSQKLREEKGAHQARRMMRN